MTQRKSSGRSKNSSSPTLPWTQIVIAFIAAIIGGWGYLLSNKPAADQLPPDNQPTQNTSTTTTTNDPNHPNSPTSSQTTPTHRLISWNLYNFSTAKSETALQKIVQILKDYDIVALQEITTSGAGAQAVADLALRLNDTGNKWDYVISNPTTGEGSERYAFLWKSKRATLTGRAFLSNAHDLANTLDREPYIGHFKIGKRTITLANFHAVPATKKPEQEIIQLPNLHDAYGDGELLIVGDFNLSQSHNAFTALKAMGYEAALQQQKTSIKLTNLDGQYLSQEYDNIFYETRHFSNPLRAGVVDFVQNNQHLSIAREVSDHLPVWVALP